MGGIGGDGSLEVDGERREGRTGKRWVRNGGWEGGRVEGEGERRVWVNSRRGEKEGNERSG